MTKFAEKSFTVPFMSKEYSEGWERIFGKKDSSPDSRSADINCFCPLLGNEEGEHEEDCVWRYVPEPKKA